MCCARSDSLTFAFVMTSALLRVDNDRAAFVEWMYARGTCVDDILHAADVCAEWHRLLCEMRKWMSGLPDSRCRSSLPRASVTLEEIVAQRRVVRLLLPGVDDHAAAFCATLASLLALRVDDPTDLLCAIDAAMTDVEAPPYTSQSRPRSLLSV
jgi:hypothetical protein